MMKSQLNSCWERMLLQHADTLLKKTPSVLVRRLVMQINLYVIWGGRAGVCVLQFYLQGM